LWRHIFVICPVLRTVRRKSRAEPHKLAQEPRTDFRETIREFLSVSSRKGWKMILENRWWQLALGYALQRQLIQTQCS